MCFSTAAVLSSAAYLPIKYLKLKLTINLHSILKKKKIIYTGIYAQNAKKCNK